MHLVEPRITSTFTTTELERLAAYRAAVAAGFYSDWDGSAASTDPAVLAWLPHEEREYPFTAEERRALERLRARVAGGGLADDQPPAAASGSGPAERAA
jgi:hypothetical protein